MLKTKKTIFLKPLNGTIKTFKNNSIYNAIFFVHKKEERFSFKFLY